MPKPTPMPIDPSELVKIALGVIQADRFPYLATCDGDQPRVRPVSPVKTDGFVVYVANMRFYHKTGEIAADPKVELCYMDEHHNQLRITGTRRDRDRAAAAPGNLGRQRPHAAISRQPR